MYIYIYVHELYCLNLKLKNKADLKVCFFGVFITIKFITGEFFIMTQSSNSKTMHYINKSLK